MAIIHDDIINNTNVVRPVCVCVCVFISASLTDDVRRRSKQSLSCYYYWYYYYKRARAGTDVETDENVCVLGSRGWTSRWDCAQTKRESCNENNLERLSVLLPLFRWRSDLWAPLVSTAPATAQWWRWRNKSSTTHSLLLVANWNNSHQSRRGRRTFWNLCTRCFNRSSSYTILSVRL